MFYRWSFGGFFLFFNSLHFTVLLLLLTLCFAVFVFKWMCVCIFFACLSKDEWSECVLLFSHGLHYVSVCIVLTDFNKKFFCIKCTHSFTWLLVCLCAIAAVVLLGCFDASSHHVRRTLSILTFVDMSIVYKRFSLLSLPLSVPVFVSISPFNLTTDFLDS